MDGQDMESRLKYVGRLVRDIKDNNVENYILACSEVETWCAIIRANCHSLGQEGVRFAEKARSFEKDLKDYRIYLAGQQIRLDRAKALL